VSPEGTPDVEARARALAALAFASAAAVAYIAQRIFDHALVEGEVDPLSMLRQTHAAYVWRAATAAFWGGLAALVVYAVARARRVDLAAGPFRSPAIAVAVATLFAVFALLAWAFP